MKMFSNAMYTHSSMAHQFFFFTSHHQIKICLVGNIPAVLIDPVKEVAMLGGRIEEKRMTGFLYKFIPMRDSDNKVYS